MKTAITSTQSIYCAPNATQAGIFPVAASSRPSINRLIVGFWCIIIASYVFSISPEIFQQDFVINKETTSNELAWTNSEKPGSRHPGITSARVCSDIHGVHRLTDSLNGIFLLNDVCKVIDFDHFSNSTFRVSDVIETDVIWLHYPHTLGPHLLTSPPPTGAVSTSTHHTL